MPPSGAVQNNPHAAENLKPSSVSKTASAHPDDSTIGATKEAQTVVKSLSQGEMEALKKHETAIENGLKGNREPLVGMAKAFQAIKSASLFRPHETFEAYSLARWKIGKSHAYRLASAGEILNRLEKHSPRGETLKLFTSEAHFRPLASLTAEMQDRVVDKVAAWNAVTGTHCGSEGNISPRMVQAAVRVLNPPAAPKGNKAKADKQAEMVEKLVSVVEAAKKSLPKDTSTSVVQTFDQLIQKAQALGNPRRTTGIDWTDSTWNPLVGCTRASAGCDNCYAAKLVATRQAHQYQGFAQVIEKKGVKTYAFTGKILLAHSRLSEPLEDKTPRLYFVNSMSDLFHKNVPDDFIREVFQIMEAASWHKFQVLTKRPDRMADFSQEYFKDKDVAPNIWLGTSTEDQKTFDERLPHLLKTKTAVRWLSCEPLIGEIKPKTLKGVDWVVVGGESGSDRPMKAAWARSLRDQCKKEAVPFFFKQWGEYGEDGQKLKKKRKDGLTPKATLDGVIHNAYPTLKTAVKK